MKICFGCRDFTPRQIHISIQDDSASAITISWVTMNSRDTKTHIVKYGSSPGKYAQKALGSFHPIPNALSGYVHEVQLNGLEPATRYYFICGDDAKGFSEERSFTTAPREILDTTFKEMPMITVDKINDTTFMVTVESSTRTTHEVKVSSTYYRELTGGKIPCKTPVKKSFEFLLGDRFCAFFYLKTISIFTQITLFGQSCILIST